MSNNAQSSSSTGLLTPPQVHLDQRAAHAAHERLDAKLHALGRLAGLTAMQVNQASLERGQDAFRYPASNSQRNEAFELAAKMEASLPDHAGTALITRAELTILLLDPAGGDRLTEVLRRARLVLGV